MGRIFIAGTVLASALALGLAANSATAAPIALPAGIVLPGRDGDFVQQIHLTCRCERRWPSREYWQWDDLPIWDDSWVVLKPNFWGSPEPRLVPADIWACEWHLPATRSWRRYRRQCPAWQ
jgi:hypothetical protein